MSLSGPMATGLKESVVLMSYCLELKLPGRDLRLTDGGFYSFTVDGAVQTFTAKDPDFGALGGAGQITEGVSEGFPTLDIVILTASNAGVAALAAPEAQGSQARLWVVLLDKVTNVVIGQPKQRFKGYTDVPAYAIEEGGKTLSIGLNSVLAAARQADEGARMNDGFHQQRHPGERGFEFSQSIEQVDYWGSTQPSSTSIDVAAVQRRMLAALGVAS